MRLRPFATAALVAAMALGQIPSSIWPSLVPPTASADPVIDQRQESVEPSVVVDVVENGQQLAQTLTVGVSGRLDRFEVPVTCPDATTIAFFVARTTESGTPSGNHVRSVAASGTIVKGTPTTWFGFTWTQNDPASYVRAGERIAIHARVNFGGPCQWYHGPNGDPYAGGRSWSRPTNTAAWTPLSETKNDLPFRVFVEAGLPDLRPTRLVASRSVMPGGTASYAWTVTNEGAVGTPPVTPMWGDQLWLSTTPSLAGRFQAAGGIVAPSGLAVGASYDRTFSATIPGTVANGDYWLVLETDASSQIVESDEADNAIAVRIRVGPPRPRVAYIHGPDGAARDAWYAFITSRGFDVDTIDQAAVAAADLSVYQAIVIGSDTGNGDPRVAAWGPPAAVSNIAGTGKKTIGVGEGGSKFFDTRTCGGVCGAGYSNIGWLGSWRASGDGAIVVSGSDAAWTTPNATGLASGATAALYTAPTVLTAVFEPPAVVARIGRQTDAATHYPIVSEGCDVHWGFDASASSLTALGGNVFHNLLAACSATYRIGGTAYGPSESPVPGVSVKVHRADGGAVAASAVTDAAGRYSVSVEDGHTYHVHFMPPPGHAPQTYSGQFSAASATPVTVSGADRTGIDAFLEPGYTAQGRVTDAAGAPLAGVTVQAYLHREPERAPVCCYLVRETTTDELGRFALDLASGPEYKLRFAAGLPTEQWWNGASNAGNDVLAGWTAATPFAMLVPTYSCTGVPYVLFDNSNTGGVTGGGIEPAFDTDGVRLCVTEIWHYHHGDETPPNVEPHGRIGLVATSGGTSHDFPAYAGVRDDGRPYDWFASIEVPSDAIVHGGYRCTDSRPATWSQNEASGRAGFCRVTVTSTEETLVPGGRTGLDATLGTGGSITATVRHDLDRDGARDDGEPSIAASSLRIYRLAGDHASARIEPPVAQNSGQSSITATGLLPGYYEVVESDAEGYASTGISIPPLATVKPVPGSKDRAIVQVAAGSAVAFDFMDAVAAGTGIAEFREILLGAPHDVVLGNAIVTLIEPDGTRRRMTAGPDGAYEFQGLAPDTTYVVGFDGSAGGRHYVGGLRFTTDAQANANVGRMQPVINDRNHTWITALRLGSGVAVEGQVWRRGQAAWYRVPVGPGQSVTIELRGCGFPCDLVVYKDLVQVAAALRANAGTTAGVRANAQGDIFADDLDADDLDADDLDADDLDADDLDADDLDADDLDADDLDADDLDADDLDADDLDADDLDADDLDADDLDADDLDADDLDADDLDADDLDADDLDADGDGLTGYGPVYVAAQRKGLRAASLTPGLADETVTVNTRDLSGYLYVRVAGGSSLTDTFEIVAHGTPTCVGAPLVARAPSTAQASLPTGRRTLILTDTAAYGLAEPARAAFLATLGQLAAHATVQGHVLDLAGDAAIQQLRADWIAGARCVDQANLVTDAIKEVVRRFRAQNPGLEHVINVGGDPVIPFRRVTDQSEISRESRYSPPVDGTTASDASLAADTFLNDDFYVSNAVEGAGRTLWLPDLAIGRLVESPADVTAAVASYLATGGVAAPTTALSSGYDFNLDLAANIASELGARGVAVDSSLASDTWTAADWRAKVLAGAVSPFGILSLQGHFSANRLVPADNGQRVLSTELAALPAAFFRGTLVYSIGCHAGYSIVDAHATDLTQPAAFPETFGAKGANVIGNTGYGYGETVLIKNSELLMALLTLELGYASDVDGASWQSGVPVGKALANAKRAYLGQTATPRGIDLKVVGVSQLYGFPMMRYRLPAQQARPVAPAVQPTPVPGSDVSAADLSPSYALELVGGTGQPSYYRAAGAAATGGTTTIPNRPIMPLVEVPANAAGQVLQGVVFLGGQYSVVAPFTPKSSNAVTEQTGETPLYVNDAFMPVIPARTNLFDGDVIQLIPFQYRSDAGGAAGTAHVFASGMSLRGYWSARTGAGAIADAPVIRDVSLKVENGELVVLATIRGLADPGVAEVYVTYTDTAGTTRAFTSLAMAGGPTTGDGPGLPGFTRVYSATLPGDPATKRLLIQAVGGTGKVAAATDNGQLYGLATVSTAPPAPPVQSDITVSAPATAAYRSAVTATATLVAGGAPLAGRQVTFKLGGQTRIATTNASGVATATLDAAVTPRAAPYQLTATYAGEPEILGDAATADVTVTRAPTSLQLVPASPQYSDAASVARLVSGGITLNEQPIVIARGASSVATATDFAGEVRFDTMDLGAGAGPSALTITYPGNDRYLGATATATVGVRAEGATLSLAAMDPQPTGPVTVTAAVAQDADGSLGDLRRASVRFTFTPASGAAIVATAPVGAGGAATATVSLPAAVYRVDAQVVGDFASEVVGITLPVYDPSTFVTGGGFVRTGAAAIGVPPNARATFGFVAKYLSDNVTPSGMVLVHVKSPTGRDNDDDAKARANGSVIIRSTSLDWLVISGNGAAFTGDAKVNGIAGYVFRVDVVDTVPDLFVIRVWDPTKPPSAGGSYDSPTHEVRGTLTGGAIRIHR